MPVKKKNIFAPMLIILIIWQWPSRNLRLEKSLYISSQAAFGGSPKNRAGNEEDKDKPIYAYGKSKLMAENKLRKFTQFFRVWILRAPSVYGPGDKGLFGMWENIHKNRQTTK